MRVLSLSVSLSLARARSLSLSPPPPSPPLSLSGLVSALQVWDLCAAHHTALRRDPDIARLVEEFEGSAGERGEGGLESEMRGCRGDGGDDMSKSGIDIKASTWVL